MAKARKGRPAAKGKIITTLPNSGKAARPPKSGGGKTNQGGGYGGAPLVTSNPVNVGEKSVGGASNSPVFPSVYKGGAQVTKRPKPPRAKGSSGSGAAGAI